jgi:hypothetical protein
MYNTITIEKNISEVLTLFPKALAENKQLLLKKMTAEKFALVSKEKYEKVNMIEKEVFFVTGRFTEENGQTHIEYQIRANATFRIIFFMVIPLMVSPTLALGLSSKANTEGVANGFVNVGIYCAIIVLSVCIGLFYDKKLTLKGDLQFRNFIEMLKK